MRTKIYKTTERLPKKSDANHKGEVYVRHTPDRGFVPMPWELVTPLHDAWRRDGFRQYKARISKS